MSEQPVDSQLLNDVLGCLIRRFGTHLLRQSHMEAIRAGVAIAEQAYKGAAPVAKPAAITKPQPLPQVNP